MGTGRMGSASGKALLANLALGVAAVAVGLVLVLGLGALFQLELRGRWNRLRSSPARPDGAAIPAGANIQEAEVVGYVLDSRCGWKLAPHVQIHRAIGGLFDVRNRTNSEGFLDREHDLKTDFFRIAFVGDSLTEAQQVKLEQRFSELTESYVYEKSGKTKAVEVMNFGISSWGTAHEYGAIKHFVMKYEPDEVWIFFFSGNDLGDNSPLLNGPPFGPTYTYARDGALADVRFGWPSPPPVMREARRVAGADIDNRQWDLEVWPYMFTTEVDSPVMHRILSDTRGIFRLARDLVANKGSRLRVVYFPSGWETHPDLFERSAAEWRRKTPSLSGLAADIPEKRMAAMMAELDIPFLSTTPLMIEFGSRMSIDHYSPFGHERIAEVLSQYILEHSAVPTLSSPPPPGR